MYSFVRPVAVKLLVGIFLLGLTSGSAVAGPDKGAKKAYEKGDFDKAVTILVEKLRKKRKHQDNIRLMETVLPLAQKQHVQAAQECEMQNDWDCAYEQYRQAKAIGDEVRTLPPVLKEVKKNGKKEKVEYTFEIASVDSQIVHARDRAISSHYERGVQLQEAGQFRDAAVAFRSVVEYNRTYQDASVRYEQCRAAGMLRIAVMPFGNISGKRRYGRIDDQLTEYIISNAINANPEFLQFVTRDYLTQLMVEQGLQQSDAIDQSTATDLGKKVGVHAFVFGKVLSVVENYPPDAVEEGTSSAKVYIGKGSQKVYAKWKKYTRKGSVKITASYQIVDVETGTIISAQQESAIGERIIRWATFTGNEAALPDHVRFHNLDGDVPVDPPEVLANRAIEKLGERLANKLVTFFE